MVTVRSRLPATWGICHHSRWLVLALASTLSAMSCGSSESVTERDFVARNDAERDARERMRFWVDAASRFIERPELSPATKQQLRAAVAGSRTALSRYNRLRQRGTTRATVMMPIQASAGAIVADDATGIGVADDILLIPLALAAIATHVLTDDTATSDEIGQAWNQTLDSIRNLGAVAAAAAAMTTDDIERRCMEKLHQCLENPWQPEWNREVFGHRKECRGCYRLCKSQAGTWPENKCPR